MSTAVTSRHNLPGEKIRALLRCCMNELGDFKYTLFIEDPSQRIWLPSYNPTENTAFGSTIALNVNGVFIHRLAGAIYTIVLQATHREYQPFINLLNSDEQYLLAELEEECRASLKANNTHVVPLRKLKKSRRDVKKARKARVTPDGVVSSNAERLFLLQQDGVTVERIKREIDRLTSGMDYDPDAAHVTVVGP